MTKVDLKEILNGLGISHKVYSLDSELFADRLILYENYDKWEVFYSDEKGNRNDERVFNSENDACSFMLKLLSENSEIQHKYGLR